MLVGGYPEVNARPSTARRKAWFNSYISTMIQRDVRDIADIEGRTQLPRLLELLAVQAMSLLNMSEVSRSMGIPHTTLKRYLSLLEATFLVQTLPAWSGNVRKRLIRSPKIMLNDTGLMAHLLGLDRKRLLADSPAIGPLLESFVAHELGKQITWSRLRPKLYYYRTAAGREVDFVLEGAGGQLVGIEVKASATLDSKDVRGLEDLAETAGKRFHRGVVLYAGAEVVPFARNVHALPVSALWHVGAEPISK
jgi:predicted AAA+ superfamily ATPase